MVAVDYVSKWVESVDFLYNKGKSVVQFLKRYIFARFGTPRDIITDGGSHFCNQVFCIVIEKIWRQTQVHNTLSSINKSPSWGFKLKNQGHSCKNSECKSDELVSEAWWCYLGVFQWFQNTNWHINWYLGNPDTCWSSLNIRHYRRWRS